VHVGIQLGVNPDTIASATNDRAQQITRSESTPDLGRRQVLALELKACRPGHDEQVREMAERGDDVPGDAVAKEILGGIVGEVLEGNTATDGRPARCAGMARLATSTGSGAAPSPSSSRRIPD